MKVREVPIDLLKPYKGNAKKHPAEQIEHIANSLREFGWQQPIVADAEGVVVIGHGRLMAAKSLGMKTVPVARAEGLSEAQIKALRLVDNQTNSESGYDMDLLNTELDELKLDFDMSDFGFDMDDEDEGLGIWEGKKDNLNPMRYDAFENQEMMMFDTSDNYYGIPVMEPTDVSGDKFLRFCDWKECQNPAEYIAHFYYDDFKFMAAWRDPDRYVPRLREFKAVVCPDFSSYSDFPRALQILGAYRRQWCGAYWQYLGLNVIADVQWGYEDSYEWAFLGIPKKSTVAISSLGIKNNKDFNGVNDNLFVKGYNEMMNRLEPTTVLWYGKIIDGCEGNIIHIPHYYEEKFGKKESGDGEGAE